MKITIEQQNKKLVIEFYSDAPLRGGRSPDFSVGIDKAEDFLVAIDTFLKRSNNELTIIKNAELEFDGTGLLTERIVRSIMLGLNFHPCEWSPEG